AVWWLNKRIRLERENCCDDVAIALCGDAVEYARALTLMEEWRTAPTLAMAANRGPLSARITRLLDMGKLRWGFRSIGLTASAMCLAVAVLSANAIFGLAHRANAQAAPAAASPSPAAAARPAPAAKAAPAAKLSPARPERGEAAPETAGSYIEGLKALGLGD